MHDHPEPLPPLTLPEQRMLRTARLFAAERRLSEQGQPILQSRLEELVRRMSKVRQPAPRPVDVEQPRVPCGAAERSAAIRARQAEVPPEPKPVAAPRPKPVSPPLPPLHERLDDELRAVVAEVGTGASNPVIGKRLGISEDRVKYAVSRAKRILGVSDRKVLAVALAEVLALGEGDAGGESGAVWPPAASNPQKRARGASEPQRPAEGPFWPIDSVPSAEESPVAAPGHAPDAPAGHGSPTGPPRPATGGTEPYSATAATEAARS
jgi:DNA-binding CsgD family transcriptional regulator